MTAAQREPGNAGGRDDPGRRRQAERMGRVIEIALRATRFDPCRARRRVDPDASHRRHVDDQSVVDAAEPRPVMTAAPDRDGLAALASEIDGRDHIRHVGAARDQARAFVDHAVVESSTFVVVRVVRGHEDATKILRDRRSGWALSHRNFLSEIVRGLGWPIAPSRAAIWSAAASRFLFYSRILRRTSAERLISPLRILVHSQSGATAQSGHADERRGDCWNVDVRRERKTSYLALGLHSLLVVAFVS